MPRISDPPIHPRDIWTYATRTLTEFKGTPRSDLLGTDEPVSTSTVVRLANLDNLDALISSRASPSDILVDPATDRIDGSLLDVAVSSRYAGFTLAEYADIAMLAGATYTPADSGIFVGRSSAYFTTAEYYSDAALMWIDIPVQKADAAGRASAVPVIGDGTNLRFVNENPADDYLVLFRWI